MTGPHLRAPPVLAGRAGSAAVSPAPSTGQQAGSTHPHSRGRSPHPPGAPWKLRFGGSGFCLMPKLLLESSVATPALGGEGRQGRESEDGAKLPASTEHRGQPPQPGCEGPEEGGADAGSRGLRGWVSFRPARTGGGWQPSRSKACRRVSRRCGQDRGALAGLAHRS